MRLHAVALGLTALVLSPATVPAPAVAAADEFSTAFKARLEAHLAPVRTAIFEQRTWEKQGKKEEITVGTVWWAGTDRIRIDVREGRGGNATAILLGETIHGFKRALSFIKLKYDVREDTVLSIRGHDMRETGPIDDLRYALANWDRVHAMKHGDDAMLHYKDAFGLDAEIRLRLSDLLPHTHTVREKGVLVEKYEYSEMRWNAEIPEDRFKL